MVFIKSDYFCNGNYICRSLSLYNRSYYLILIFFFYIFLSVLSFFIKLFLFIISLCFLSLFFSVYSSRIIRRWIVSELTLRLDNKQSVNYCFCTQSFSASSSFDCLTIVSMQLTESLFILLLVTNKSFLSKIKTNTFLLSFSTNFHLESLSLITICYVK